MVSFGVLGHGENGKPDDGRNCSVECHYMGCARDGMVTSIEEYSATFCSCFVSISAIILHSISASVFTPIRFCSVRSSPVFLCFRDLHSLHCRYLWTNASSPKNLWHFSHLALSMFSLGSLAFLASSMHLEQCLRLVVHLGLPHATHFPSMCSFLVEENIPKRSPRLRHPPLRPRCPPPGSRKNKDCLLHR
jgi:hypothetical protein